jgi:hypothetical protein
MNELSHYKEAGKSSKRMWMKTVPTNFIWISNDYSSSKSVPGKWACFTFEAGLYRVHHLKQPNPTTIMYYYYYYSVALQPWQAQATINTVP